MKPQLFSGAELHQHAVSQDWLAEMVTTSSKPNWQGDLRERINEKLKDFDGSVQHVGHQIGAIQFQFANPIAHVEELISEDTRLNVAWATFNTWDPITKKSGTRTLRFGPDTAVTMVLVRSPKTTGSGWDWYLLARSKCQLAVQARFVEFSRMWDIGEHPSDVAWNLFDRDFPGLRDGETNAECVESIRHIPLGTPVLENTAEFMNDTSDHLIVVTLSEPMDIKTLREKLVAAKIEQEYGNRDGYSDLSALGAKDLFSQPMAFELEEAAKHLNGHMTGKESNRDAMFRETFSLRCWEHFLALYGDEFPEVKPQIAPLSELLDA